MTRPLLGVTLFTAGKEFKHFRSVERYNNASHLWDPERRKRRAVAVPSPGTSAVASAPSPPVSGRRFLRGGGRGRRRRLLPRCRRFRCFGSGVVGFRRSVGRSVVGSMTTARVSFSFGLEKRRYTNYYTSLQGFFFFSTSGY